MKLFAAALTLSLAAILHAQTPTTADHHDGAMQDMHPGDHKAKPPVPPSKALSVTYAGHTTVLTVADLLALPQATVRVHNAHANTDEDYTGPLVSDVLAKAGLAVSHDTEPVILHSALIASATDHYFVIFSVAEVQGSFSRSQAIVAVLKSGLPDTAGGTIQLINTDGAKPARWVHGLSSLSVMTVQQNQ